MYLRHALSQRVVQRLTHCGSRTPLRLSRLSSQSSPQLALGRCRLSTASAVMKRRPSTTNMKSAVATTAAVAIAAVAGVAAAAPASDSDVPLAGGEDPMWAKEATFRTLNIESRRKRLSEAGANHLLYHTLWGKDKLEGQSGSAVVLLVAPQNAKKKCLTVVRMCQSTRFGCQRITKCWLHVFCLESFLWATLE